MNVLWPQDTTGEKQERKRPGFCLLERGCCRSPGECTQPLINVYSPDYLALSPIPACSQWLAPCCLAFRLPTPANNKEAGYGGCSFWRLLIKEMTKPSGQEEGAANA